jgi:hypothetical protein
MGPPPPPAIRAPSGDLPNCSLCLFSLCVADILAGIDRITEFTACQRGGGGAGGKKCLVLYVLICPLCVRATKIFVEMKPEIQVIGWSTSPSAMVVLGRHFYLVRLLSEYRRSNVVNRI